MFKLERYVKKDTIKCIGSPMMHEISADDSKQAAARENQVLGARTTCRKTRALISPK